MAKGKSIGQALRSGISLTGSARKKAFLDECIKKEIGADVVEAALVGGGPARQRFVRAMDKCLQKYCEVKAVDELIQAINTGKADAKVILQIIREHEECSPERCEL